MELIYMLVVVALFELDDGKSMQKALAVQGYETIEECETDLYVFAKIMEADDGIVVFTECSEVVQED